jgi:hypothetical protein
MRWSWLLLLAACARSEERVEGCIEAPASPMDLGFDRPFALRVRPECGSGVTWSQLSGPPVTPGIEGQVLSARTPAFTGTANWGVVPLSPRTQGALTFAARWQAGGRTVEERVTVAAAARARGLPNVATGARVYLGGRGWRLVEGPPGHAVGEITGALSSFLPDRDGEWVLADEAGRSLRLRSGRYDETPLDCGRSGCHPAVAAAAAHSPMTTVLARGLDQGRAAGYPGCALACHATGEPGVTDGGFTHVAAELGLSPSALDRWETTPPPLRRLGGVGCLACHGPGAVPEASARWSLLRADVCAVCHDDPPRYGHVAAWRLTRMAAADRDPRATAGPCARCHTTAGFLAATGALAGDRRAPDGVGPQGIACAACHAVHAANARSPGLLREIAAPPALGKVPSGARTVCLGCHAPDGETPSSAAALWLGRGGLDPDSGRALEGPAPHAAIAGGCVGCHRAEGGARGAGHRFAASAAACRGCHGPLPVAPEIRDRALRLWSALGQAPSNDPPHASRPTIDRGTARGRAAWNVLLVLEDPAAAAHNPRYARRLLDAAAGALP